MIPLPRNRTKTYQNQYENQYLIVERVRSGKRDKVMQECKKGS